MKQSDGWSKSYAASFAIGRLCLRKSNAFDKLVSSISPTPLLSRHFIYIDAKMNVYSSKHSHFINSGEARYAITWFNYFHRDTVFLAWFFLIKFYNWKIIIYFCQL